MFSERLMISSFGLLADGQVTLEVAGPGFSSSQTPH